MMDLQSIQDINTELGRKAKRQQLEPLTYGGNPEELKKMPNFGDYRASRFGWKLGKVFFVDNSGLGVEDELAMTFSQFVRKAKVGKGYAIIEAGQFQVRVGEFTKVRKRRLK